MNRSEAKFILQAYRPGGGDASDPEMAEALELLRTDSELARWFETSHAFDERVSDSLCSIRIPGDLRGNILAGRRVTISSRPTPKRQLFARAAALAAVLGTVAFWIANPPAQDFASYRDVMIETVATDMGALDLYSRDPAELRTFLAERSAHFDFVTPNALEALSQVGCRVLEWNGREVSLVCFSTSDGQMFHLFVVDRDAFGRSLVADPNNPQLASNGVWSSASWVAGRNAYILAGQTDSRSLQQML